MTKKKLSRPKKLFKNLLQATYEFIKGKHYAPLSKPSLAQRLNINQDHLAIFDKVLKQLREEAKIDVVENTYVPTVILASNETIKKGIISVHPRGFGFVAVGEGDDIFIPRHELNEAIDSDIVEVIVNLEAKSEKGPEGRVVKVVERKKKTLVGVITEIHSEHAVAFCPQLQGAQLAEVELPEAQKKKISVGDRFVFSIISWGKKDQITKVSPLTFIGNIKDPSKDIQEAIYAYELPTTFSKESIEEAQAYSKKVTSADLKGRNDLRELITCTIDPDTAKDFDDAISIEFKDNKFHLYVHIADVSHYVKRFSALDTEAFSRANSVYFPGTCIPMLPFELSNELCSLKEGVTRLTVSVYFVINSHGVIEKTEMFKSAIKSDKRFTYKQAKEVLDGTVKSKLEPELKLMEKLAALLKIKRKERGSVELSLPELVIKVDEQGKPIGTELVEYDITHQMIEEFMLLANEAVAKKLSQEGKSVTFRIHEEPSKDNLRDFAALVTALGYSLHEEPKPADIQRVFQEAAACNDSILGHLATCYIRSMRLASYSVDNVGHYGLCLEHYCHFTSPIRRYVDLIAHRLLFEDAYTKEEIQAIADHASDRERKASKAENSVVHLKKLRYLEQLIDKDRFHKFDAICTRIKPFGISFDLTDFMLEGFIHVSELDDDYFIFNDKRNVLQGRHTRLIYKTADRIVVTVKKLDLATREAAFQLVLKPKK